MHVSNIVLFEPTNSIAAEEESGLLGYFKKVATMTTSGVAGSRKADERKSNPIGSHLREVSRLINNCRVVSSITVANTALH